jgi:hypothetical protein
VRHEKTHRCHRNNHAGTAGDRTGNAIAGAAEGLGAEGRDFWAALMREHNIQGVAKLELVLQRALAIDRLESIRTAIEKAGVASSDALLRAEIATRAQIVRALGKLGLHQKPPSIPVGVRWRRR